MNAEKWKQIRRDEYVFNDKAFRITKEKQMQIDKMDNSVMNDKRYA